MTFPDLNLAAAVHLMFLAVWASALLLVDLWIPKTHKTVTGWLAFAGLAIALVLVSAQQGSRQAAFGGTLATDGFSTLMNFIFIGAGMLSVLMALNYLRQHDLERGEFYPLLLFSIVGMMAMGMAKDLIIVFLSLELLSIPLYVLAGFGRPRIESEEAGLKYFLLGAFSSAFLVYGIALVYGATQATSFAGIGVALDAGRAGSPLLLAGVGLIMVGMGFKVAAVPFHMWTPDVYDGAPSVVTAFMSVGAKAAGFAALVRVLFDALAPLAAEWGVVVATLAALSMVLGNVAAIAQTSMKRMLAYSSIAHAGYVAVAALIDAQGAQSNFSAGAAIFYLGAYALTNLGTWAVVLAVEKPERMTTDVADYAGLGRTQPALAAAMTLFMLSLTGLPPSIGFVAKFYVFRAALEAGYTWLVLLGVVTVLISAYYYLRVIVVMWMKEGLGEAMVPRALNFTIWLTAGGTLVFGIVPGPLMRFVESSVRGIF